MRIEMGRQNRDWARLDDELAQLCGVVPKRTRHVRLRIWSAVALLTFAAGAFAYTQRTTAATLDAAQQPTMLIGLRGVDQRVGPEDPGGTGTVCSEETYGTESQQWSCLVWAINVRHLPVVQPPPYVGPCTHLIADRDRARWICLGTGPLPPEPLPPSVTSIYA
jgi:hypothetical protein